MSLGDVRHQPRALGALSAALREDRLPHALLFCGPDGVGKELTAVALAERMLCHEPVHGASTSENPAVDGRGCGVCRSCRLVRGGTHPDLHIIHRYLNREHPDADVRKRKGLELSIDVIRHFVIEPIGLKPAMGRAKVFLVREAERMSGEAQNALLRTLEEPPDSSVLILLTTSPERLLATIRSRCRWVRFDPLPASFVEEHVRAAHPAMPEAEVEWYARVSDGSAGGALRRASQQLHEIAVEIGATLDDWCGGVGENPTPVWLKAAERLGQSWHQDDPDITDTEVLRLGMRQVLHAASIWYMEHIRGASRQIAAARVERHARDIQRIAQAEMHIDRNVQPALAVEVLLYDLRRSARSMPVGAA
jgi:DNA polymerase-3 subunit delta'